MFRNATFLKDRLGEAVASPLVTLVDDGRRPRGLGSRPFDGEGLPTRTNVPIERGVLRYWLCDSYSARKIGAKPTGSARRGVAGSPSVGASNLYFEPGALAPEEIIGSVERGLYVTDLIGFGVNVVTGDYSQGAVGHWIENGRLTHPVHEVTIAGNLPRHADGRGRGRERPRVPRRLRVADDPDPADDGERELEPQHRGPIAAAVALRVDRTRVRATQRRAPQARGAEGRRPGLLRLLIWGAKPPTPPVNGAFWRPYLAGTPPSLRT